MIQKRRNRIKDYSIPLSYEGRYFFFEPGSPKRVSAVCEYRGRHILEVNRNQPAENQLTDVAIERNVVTVTEKETNRLLYRIRPGRDETTVVFGKADGEEVSVTLDDDFIRMGGDDLRIENYPYKEVAGVVVDPEGGIELGGEIPPALLKWFRQRQSKSGAKNRAKNRGRSINVYRGRRRGANLIRHRG